MVVGFRARGSLGQSFFLLYYFVCGIGAGLLYTLAVIVYYLFSHDFRPVAMPVVGASGAVFGLMLAYGMIFGKESCTL